MGRLQGNGSLTNGVIPTRYKRIPCPVPGNAYVWLRDGGGPYYFALTIVNTFGAGSVTNVEIMGSGTTTVSVYGLFASHPQLRFHLRFVWVAFHLLCYFHSTRRSIEMHSYRKLLTSHTN